MKVEKLNASQKLESLERTIIELTEKLNEKFNNISQQFALVTDEFNKVSKDYNELAKRFNAVMKVSDSGKSLSSDAITNAIVEDEVRMLKAQVNEFIEKKIFIPSSSNLIEASSFIVGYLTDKEGNVTNPRFQLMVGSAMMEFQEKVIGKALGSTIKDDQIDQLMVITEIYSINIPSEDQENVVSVSEDNSGATVALTKKRKTK
jgi:hypothetical protein